MPDFFDRLIARGTQRPGGGLSGQAGQAEVAFALPRLPGPFERLATQPPDPFIETIEETREAGSPPTATARARLAPGVLSGTRSSLPPLLPESIISRAPAVPGEPPPVRPTPARQSPPMATPVLIGPDGPDAGTAPADQPTDRASRPEHAFPPPALPRTLAVPATAVHTAEPDDARGVQARSPEPPVVTVRIGRIEVRDTSQDRRERPKNPAKRRPAPKQTLAAYLAAANAGQNTGGAR
jgi:hypothetical protein